MKNKLLLVLFCACGSLFAQENTPADTSYWKKGGSFNLNFTRVNLTDNWAGGGQSSVSLSSLAKLFANYEKGKSSWTNSLDMAYGLTKIADGDFQKSDDQIIFISKYSQQIKTNWNMTALADFRTQFDEGVSFDAETGTSTKISQFMAPGYLLNSIGFEYKKGDLFALISPLTGKSTFVLEETLSDAGAYGVDAGSSYRFEFGALLKAGYKKTLMENVDFITALNMFTPYEDFGNFDVNWENTLQFKINDYLSTTFTATLIYDEDMVDEVQYKDVLNIGFLYKF